MNAKIRVVVVTYSPGASLPKLLASLRAGTAADYEVILADNGSTDGAVETAALNDPARVSIIRTGGNVGYGTAANIGAARSDSEWVVIANPDITVEPGAVDELIAAAGRWPKGGAFGPLIRTPEGQVYPSARELPTLGRGIGHAVFGWWWPSNPWTASYRKERGEPVEAPCGWLSGSFLLLRREAWQSVTGFDPGYFMYFEDVDLGARLAAARWLNIYVPSSVVTHDGGHATKRDRSAMVKAHHASALRYLNGRYPGMWNLPLRAVLRFGLLLHQWLSIKVAAVAEGAAPRRTYEDSES